MDLFDRPAADSIATVQKNFQEADGPGVVDFDSGITDGANGDEQGEPLQQREVERAAAGMHTDHKTSRYLKGYR